MSDNVIRFPTQGGSRNRKCPKCGSEWWIVEAVCMDEDLHIGGFAGIPECHGCSLPEPLKVVQDD